jgi:hypothetical protein
VGTWVWVRAGRDRFVQDVQPQAPAFGQRSGFGSPWFKSASPPISFTLDSLVDFTVLVTPTTRFFATYSFPDGECYGADRFSSEMFWPLTSEPSPGSTSSVSAYGRFEGGILIANDVWVCDPPRDRRWSEAEK